MKFGVSIPTCREGMDVPPGYAGPKEIVHLAKVAEKLGFDSGWGNDHITPSKQIRTLYGKIPNFHEILITLTYCAAVTKRLQLGLGVIVIPFRDPIILAKQLATMDYFSGGRILFGVGLGRRDEFEMLYPEKSQAHRGAMLDEALQAINLLLTEPVASFKGKYYEFRDVVIEPKPLQKPFPTYVSGDAPTTVERVVKLATGMMMFSPTVENARQRIEKLHKVANELGRDVSQIEVVISTTLSIASTHEEATKRFQTSLTGRRFGVGADIEETVRKHFIGTPEEIVERISQLQAAGVTHCVVPSIAADTVPERIAQMQMFAEEVIPRFKKAV